MTQSMTNNATTTLNGDINATVTTIVVTSASTFPGAGSAPYTILIDSEYMLVTGGFGTNTWTVTRGVEGSTPASHNGTTSPAAVQLELTVGVMQAFADGGPNNAWTFLRPSGLTGAVSTSRYVGGTAGGPPSSGTFQQGDYAVDQTLGLIWVCIVAGSPGTFLSSGTWTYYASTLAAAATTFGIASIPQQFSMLEMDIYARSTLAAVSDLLEIVFNGDTTSGAYNSVVTYAGGTGAPPSVQGANSALGANNMLVGDIAAASAPAGAYDYWSLRIANYASTTVGKSMNAQGGVTKSFAAGGFLQEAMHGNYNTATAITSITVQNTAQFAAGSFVRVRLYP